MTKVMLTPIIIFLLLLSGTIQANKMSGMYSYMADAALFLECGQTKRLPVAMEGDNIALQRAYLKSRYQPGKSLLVTFKGHTGMRPKMEGDGQETVIIVDQFLSITQQERCTGIVPPSTLSNTYWKLVEIDGQKINLSHNSTPLKQKNAIRDLYFIIKKENIISGFSGCNKFSGNFNSDGKKIKIGPLMSTQMACPSIEIEQQFNTRLTKADNYHIKGESLELFQGKKSVAKFIAMYF